MVQSEEADYGVGNARASEAILTGAPFVEHGGRLHRGAVRTPGEITVELLRLLAASLLRIAREALNVTHDQPQACGIRGIIQAQTNTNRTLSMWKRT